MCHNNKAIGEEENGKPPHEIHFSRKTQGPISGFCYVLNRVCCGNDYSTAVDIKLQRKTHHGDCESSFHCRSRHLAILQPCVKHVVRTKMISDNQFSDGNTLRESNTNKEENITVGILK